MCSLRQPPLRHRPPKNRTGKRIRAPSRRAHAASTRSSSSLHLQAVRHHVGRRSRVHRIARLVLPQQRHSDPPSQHLHPKGPPHRTRVARSLPREPRRLSPSHGRLSLPAGLKLHAKLSHPGLPSRRKRTSLRAEANRRVSLSHRAPTCSLAARPEFRPRPDNRRTRPLKQAAADRRAQPRRRPRRVHARRLALPMSVAAGLHAQRHPRPHPALALRPVRRVHPASPVPVATAHDHLSLREVPVHAASTT